MKADKDLTVEEWYEEWQLTWIDPNCGRDHFHGIIRRIQRAAKAEGFREGAKAQQEAQRQHTVYPHGTNPLAPLVGFEDTSDGS